MCLSYLSMESNNQNQLYLEIEGAPVPVVAVGGPSPFTAPGRSFTKKIYVRPDEPQRNYVMLMFVLNTVFFGLVFSCLLFDRIPVQLKTPPSPTALLVTNAINKIRHMAGIRPIQAGNAADDSLEPVGEMPEIQDTTVIDLTLAATTVTFICSMLPWHRKRRHIGYQW